MSFGQEPEEFRSVSQNVKPPEPVVLTPIDLQTFVSEYVVCVPNLIIHVYRKDELLWRTADAQLLWDAMVDTFRMKGREDRLRVEFIPEAYGWCITVYGVASIMPPTKELVRRSLELFEEKRNASLDPRQSEAHQQQES